MAFPRPAVRAIQVATNKWVPRAQAIATDGVLGPKSTKAIRSLKSISEEAADDVRSLGAAVAVPVTFLIDYTVEDLKGLVSEVSKARGVSPLLAQMFAQIESGFNPLAISATGAAGLYQFVKSTGEEVSRKLFGAVMDRHDPQYAVPMGVHYIRECAAAAKVSPLDQSSSNAAKIYACFNLGPGAGADLLAGRITARVARSIRLQGGEIAQAGPDGYLSTVAARFEKVRAAL